MSQQWLFKDNHQAQQEFAKKEKALTTGILVLIEQTVYHFEDKKEWETWQGELSKNIVGLWVRERDK